MPLYIQIRRWLVQPRRSVSFVLAVARQLSIQIQRWPMQIEVWRFVGSVSAVAGLLCYALSSSFIHLFGHWNSLKIFLYLIFSFIILFTTLFAKLWQCSTSILFKTRMTVMVLIATALYSFFYDVAVKGKPDAYILISCVAFAVMSLSLSKQTQYGYERDLLTFFLGCLITQLMKIHLWLFFVGAGFSYSLIHSRPSLDATAATPQSEFSEDHMVIQVEHSEEANSNSAIQIDSQQVDTDSAIQMDLLQVNDILIMPRFKACISELEKNDQIILSGLYKYVEKYLLVYNFSMDQVVTDDNLIIDSLPPETINSLHETAKLMVAAGFEKECCHMYSSSRREFLQKCLMRLHFSEINSEESVEFLIKKWMKASCIALRILFPNERRLCDCIFNGFSSVAGLSFMEVCRELTIGLLNFPNNFATERCSLTNLDCSLKVFKTLSDFIAEFESVFSDEYSAPLKNEAIKCWRRLREAIKVIFMEPENHIFCSDMAPNAAPTNGGIDPITHSVVRCFRSVLESRDTLEQIFKEYPMVAVGDRERTSSSLSIQMNQIMELLDSNLEAKSKNYTHPTFGHVFMVNNCKCIVRWVENSGFASILGNDWIRQHTKKFQQNLEHYQRTWSKVFDILKLDSNESEESMKEKLKLFNMHFKEMCSFQYVLDEQLRQGIRRSIEINLYKANTNFIVRFQNLGKHASDYIEYGMFDIKTLLAKATSLVSWTPDSTPPLNFHASLDHPLKSLEEEFRSLMELSGVSSQKLPFDLVEEGRNGEEKQQIPVVLPVTDYGVLIDTLPSGTINDLHEIAKRMVVGGFGKECSHVYSSCRREFLEESLSRLGLKNLSIDAVNKMTFHELEHEMEKWIKASNLVLRILLQSERKLCNRVFFGFSSTADFSFMEVFRGFMFQLLDFANAIAYGSHSAKRSLKVLDVFKTLHDLIPEFESLFPEQYGVLLRNEAIPICNWLGAAIRGIFLELEILIQRDPRWAAVPGGGLHPITCYVMNYLHAACQSRLILEQVIEEYSRLDDSDRAASSYTLSVQMHRFMELLESNLEANSKIYKDTALSYVFLMNNGRYIVQKAKDSELGTLLGDDWIKKNTAKVKHYHARYQRSSWNKVLGFLKLDSSYGSVGPNGAAKAMKEKIKLFNTHFDEICKVQCSWFVFDEQLREEIRISLEKILLPEYGNFIARFHSVPEISKHANKYIKYGIEDIEAKLNDLFQVSCGSNGSRK